LPRKTERVQAPCAKSLARTTEILALDAMMMTVIVGVMATVMTADEVAAAVDLEVADMMIAEGIMIDMKEETDIRRVTKYKQVPEDQYSIVPIFTSQLDIQYGAMMRSK
jgi:hypothetical protein